MILDGHMHLMGGEQRDREAFLRGLHAAGVSGGVVISLPPASFGHQAQAAAARLDDLHAWVAGAADLHPFFWIDPLESDALEQVALAVRQDVRGFKVICDRFFPGDERALPVYRAIAEAGRPMLFHAGILWDGKPSSRYNRPAEFEELLEVPGLRFALAHIGWPWCDELIAVYGKFLYAGRPDPGAEMFIDLTPGTPPIYRREALARIFTVGYPVERNVLFGSDSVAERYGAERVAALIASDTKILDDLGLGEDVRRAIFGANLRRFLGLPEGK